MRFAAHNVLGQDIIPASWTTNVWFPLIAAGILATILNFKRNATTALCVLQLGMLLATWNFSRGLTWMDSQLSARGVIAVSHTDIQSLRSTDLFAYDIPRGIHYGLNFYLRRDLPEWTTGSRGLVFSSWKAQSRLQAQGYVCQQHEVFPAAILCKPPDTSPAHPTGSGQPQ
jgi:signal transduction histidine kinase